MAITIQKYASIIFLKKNPLVCWVRLFHSKNWATITVFGQIMAAWPQGLKKNCYRLHSDRKAERPQKENETFSQFLKNI